MLSFALFSICFRTLCHQFAFFREVISELTCLIAKALSYLIHSKRFFSPVKNSLKKCLTSFSIHTLVSASWKKIMEFCSPLNNLLEGNWLTVHHLQRRYLANVAELEHCFECWSVGISLIHPPIDIRPVNTCSLSKLFEEWLPPEHSRHKTGCL